ncbi:ATP-binding protein [Flavobacterium sp.]|uniref:sensor histidine kinase n=1 Tax=Flavobacterium sp. TaxID=239 RepID=UPI001204F521|nr:ATP-binding protein [Flavobacterium sp.]RZJ72561.1 MAG: hypothetical protein EOO49_06525 [Flavobacterium sp.]
MDSNNFPNEVVDLSTLANAANACCLIAVPSLEIVAANGKMLSYWSKIGKKMNGKVQPHDAVFELIGRCLAVGVGAEEKASQEFSITGDLLYFDHEVRPLGNPSEEIVTVAYSVYDVTDGVPQNGSTSDNQKKSAKEDLKSENRSENLTDLYSEISVANKNLEVSNDKLRASNEQLSEYAYIVSHDLQEPLRKISFYASVLDETAHLSENDKIITHKIGESAKRMRKLLGDVLEYSKLQRSQRMFRPVDLNEAIGNVLEDFEIQIAERNAKIEVGNLPKIDGIGLQINQLFCNLLSNALKFCDRLPLIEITSNELSQDRIKSFFPDAEASSSYYDIAVKDNGIGFEAKYNEQIFEIFKRLHSQGDFPGSGIGLAHCRKIAANHGGHLYAESTPGLGSTFHFLIPNKHPK